VNAHTLPIKENPYAESPPIPAMRHAAGIIAEGAFPNAAIPNMMRFKLNLFSYEPKVKAFCVQLYERDKRERKVETYLQAN
jgi:hypothetical protein